MKKTIALIALLVFATSCLIQASQLVFIGNPPEQGVTNYFVYGAAPNSTNYVFLGSTGGATSFNIGRPAFGTTFYVTAVNDQEESDPSNIATNRFPGSPVIKIKK